MSCNLTTGFSRVCNSGLGGLKKIYLFTYIKYNRSQLERTGLTLTSFPTTTIYEYEPLRGVNVEQRMTKEDGSKFYDQSISLKFAGLQDTYALETLIKKDVRIIVQDNNGLYRLLGAYNGLYCNSINSQTGGGKSDFSGLDISFEGKEREEALFIDNLSDAGFTIDTPVVDNNYIFMDANNYIFMDSNNFIFN